MLQKIILNYEINKNQSVNVSINHLGASQDGISSNNQEDEKTLFKRSRSIHKRVLEVLNDSSSYMAVPVRATIISSLLLVPYMGVVPAMTMAMSSSIATTGMFLVSTSPLTFLFQKAILFCQKKIIYYQT